MVRRAHCKSEGWRFEYRAGVTFFYFIFFLSVFLFCFVLFVCFLN